MAALVDRLRPRLRGLRVDLAATVVPSIDVDAVLATPPATDERAPLAQVWLDGRSSSDAIVILVPRRADRVLARKIVGGAVFDEVALAEAVFVIERATASLLAARPIGVPKADAASELRGTALPPPVAPRPEPPADLAPAPVESPSSSASTTPAEPPAVAPQPTPPAPAALLPADEPAPPPAAVETPSAPPPAAPGAPEEAPEVVAKRPPAPTSFALQFGLFAGAESLSAGNAFVPDAGLIAIIERVGAATRLGVVVDADLRRSVDVATTYGTLELSGWGGHALLSLGHALGRGVARAALGPGLAVSDARVTAGPTATSTTARARTDYDPTLALQVRWDLPFARGAAVFVLAGAEVALVSGRYTADVAGTSTALLTTWPVRPMLRLGVTFGR
jgi:hypothetical protein